MNNPTPVNFRTRPDLLAKHSSEMRLLFMFKSIIVDYPRLVDPIDKAATSLFIMHSEEAIKLENEEMKQEFHFIKDFFLSKYAADVSKDLLNTIANPEIIQIQYTKMAEAFKNL